MQKLNIGVGVLSGVLLTAPLLGIMYLANEWTGLPFAPFDLFDWITRVLPGPLITFGIDFMIDALRLMGLSVAGTAKTAEHISAVLNFFAAGAVVGTLFFVFFRFRAVWPDLTSGLVVGALVGLPMTAISIAITQSTVQPLLIVLWQMGLFLVWGVMLREAYIRTNPGYGLLSADEGQPDTVHMIDRRSFLIRLGAASATITVASSSLGNLLSRAARREIEDERDASMTHQTEQSIGPSFPNSDDPVMPAPGTRPEYTPLKDHYKVFIRTSTTTIDGATWSLPIFGLVENPQILSLENIRNNYEPRDQYVTLSCISGRIGTSLISTTKWTGVSLQDILADIKPTNKARYLDMTCGDGFHETVALDLIASDQRIMLCYDWDGNPLPIDHGFPLRIWIPDLYGMKQPKWITEIEVVEDLNEGYWVKRGWDPVARVTATSVIDTVAVNAVYENNGQQLVPIGGIAFAGARGISKVEVRTDDGAWQEANLRAPLSETTWVLWRYDWPFTAGNHVVEVRCTEGDGTPQIEESRGNHPSGATGIHGKEARL
ncbi:MAG: molybdopterin-dependent oxidoreductase [Chloroflexi bacterium]|nr:molybdopterin-dependent oxidoreductase [Chloroflexota bacterium]